MGKNSFKANIRDRYKGRGNCWVRIDPDNQVTRFVYLVVDKCTVTQGALWGGPPPPKTHPPTPHKK